MKQSISLFSLLFTFFFLASSCQQPEFEQHVTGPHFLKASIENGTATKTELGKMEDGRYFAFWLAGDSLAVYVDDSQAPVEYVLSDGAGTPDGIFAGALSGQRYVALYPYKDRTAEGLKDYVLTLELPSVQYYTPGSFGEGAFPMLAVGEGSELSFKNLCSVLKVSMTGTETVKSIRFTANGALMTVSGKATVSTRFEREPYLEMAEGGSRSVTLKCDNVNLSEEEATDFFLVIPAGYYYDGFSIEVETSSGTFKRYVDYDVSFFRSMIRALAPFRCEGQGVMPPVEVPSNEIWYQKSTPVETEAGYFDRSIVSHTFDDGKGVIVFDGPVTRIGTEDGVPVFGEVYEINLPNTIEVIGPRTFRHAYFHHFWAPDNLKSIGTDAFSANQLLSRFNGKCATDDEKALVIDGEMLAYATASLEETLIIPEGVTSLAKRLFFGQTEIREVILPEGLQSIGEQCFAHCYSLETATLPGQLSYLGWYAFENCPLLREFKGDCRFVHDGRMFVDENNTIVAYAGFGATECVIPEGVRDMSDGFLTNNRTLRSITVPSTLQSIRTDWVYGCDNLEAFYGPYASEDHHCLILPSGLLAGVTPNLPVDYTLPEGIRSVFFRAFAGNKTTERLTVSDDLSYLYDGAFEEMLALRTIRLSSHLSNLSNNAFSNCPKLDSILFRTYAPPAYNAAESIAHDGLTILVPEGSEFLYMRDATWAPYASYIKGYHYDDLDEPDYYLSKDYSKDGLVTVLQNATKGNGIDVVLMADGFSDRQIDDGSYAALMNNMQEAFFSEEPYATYRDYFNVYAINVVSTTEGYDHAGQALGTFIGSGAMVGGSDERCVEYALKAVSEERMDNALVIVAMNSVGGGGTCYMYAPEEQTDADYGAGYAVAYFATGSDLGYLTNVLCHEAAGHGFAKLGDEYANLGTGTVTWEEKNQAEMQIPLGWWKNVDFTGDPTRVKWAHFLADPRYRNEGVGLFEGAFTFEKGAWRPSDYSIMRYNTGGFNAPSREAIWYRIHKLAYGDDWTYNYEDFVAYDAVNRPTAEGMATPAWSPLRVNAIIPTHPPLFVGKTWKEAMSARSDDATVDRK